MFPIRDHNPSATTPLVTWALIALNLAVQLWLVAGSEMAAYGLYDRFAMVPVEITHGIALDTLVTATFLHAGWWHLGGNMLFLWIFGDNLEEAMGRLGYLAFYLVGGAAANLCQWAVAPGSTIPVVGASGAIAAVMGGYLLLFPKAKVDVLVILVIFIRVIPIPAWIMLGLWLGLQVLSGLGANPLGGGVAYWAHTGGFLIGMAFALPVWLRRGGRASWEEDAGQPPHSAATYGALTPTRIPVVRRTR